MSRVHEEAAKLLDGLLVHTGGQVSPTIEELDYALERIEELGKEARDDDDEAYLDSVGETILNLRTKALSRKG